MQNVSRGGQGQSEGSLLLVDGLHELADDQWNTLYPLDLFLCSDELTLERSFADVRIRLWPLNNVDIPLLILDVFFL